MLYDTHDTEQHALRAAILLAKTRYNQKLAKWVRREKARLIYVDDQITTIACECAAELDADVEKVEAALRSLIADEVGPGNPPPKNQTEVPETEAPSAKQDIRATEPVLVEEIESVDEHIDLNNDSGDGFNLSACFRCEKQLDKLVAAVSPVCASCSLEISKLAQGYGTPPSAAMPQMQPQAPAATGTTDTCPYCGHPIPAGMEAQHFSECQQAQQHLHNMAPPTAVPPQQPMAATRESGPPTVAPSQDPQVYQPSDTADLGGGQPQEGQPQQPGTDEDKPHLHSEESGPADVFKQEVESLANHQAALDWSAHGPRDVEQIAQQYGLDAQQVNQHLKIIATFGSHVAVNGDFNGDPDTQGLSELPDFGGRVPSREEQVDVNQAVVLAARKTNMQPQAIEQAIQDTYGDDLGSKYFVSVSGDARYFLPSAMIAQAQGQMQGQPEQPNATLPDDPNETAQQAQQIHDQKADQWRQQQPVSKVYFGSLSDLLAWERS